MEYLPLTVDETVNIQLLSNDIFESITDFDKDLADVQGIIAKIDKETPISYIIWIRKNNEWCISDLGVVAEWRRSGVGRTLLRMALDKLNGDIFLHVRESNWTAQILYFSMGFRIDSVILDYYGSENGCLMRYRNAPEKVRDQVYDFG